MRYARTQDGVDIAFGTVGAGPALVLLPMVPFSFFQLEWQVPEYRAVVEVLARELQLVQYDARGTGLSQREVTDFSLPAMLRDLEAVVRRAEPASMIVHVSELKHLAGRTAIVTGTSRGIGPHIARALAREGMRLVLAARSSAQLEQVAADIAATSAEAIAVPTDIRDRASLVALATAATRAFDGVDVLVNNAGGDPLRPFDQYAPADVDDVLSVNLARPIELTRLLLPRMLERGRGHVVNISSMAGSMSFPNTEVYAAAKDGLVAFSRVLRADYRRRGVSSSALVLGAVAGEGQGQRTLDELGISMPRLAGGLASSPTAVARAVVQAIKRDRAVVVVMPGPGGLMKALMDALPGLGPRMNEMAGVTDMVQRLAALRAETAGPRLDQEHSVA